MGTRNLMCVVADGEYKVAQYCQWDGYLDGKGVDIADFLDKNKHCLSDLKKAVRNCTYLSENDVQKLWESMGADGSGMVSEKISNKFEKTYPELHRNCSGSELLEIIFNKNGVGLLDALNFAGDSVFCEWAYVIDLDTNTFEIYKGFNKSKLGTDERFHFLKENSTPQISSYSSDKFYPVRFLTAFPLDSVTATDIANFSSSMVDRENSVDFIAGI
jgi:hypothetical protein